MADPIMCWEARQSRWRKTYKGVPLRIKAADLGGTNRTDTVVAANQWFRQQQARIDGEQAKSTYRPNELEYLAELENIRTTAKSLLAVMRGDPGIRQMLIPKIDILKQRESSIQQALRKPILPPINDSLRNPLYISPERIEGEVIVEARQQVADTLRSTVTVTDEELKNEGAVPEDAICVEDFFEGNYIYDGEFFHESEFVDDEKPPDASTVFLNCSSLSVFCRQSVAFPIHGLGCFIVELNVISYPLVQGLDRNKMAAPQHPPS